MTTKMQFLAAAAIAAALLACAGSPVEQPPAGPADIIHQAGNATTGGTTVR